MQPAQAWVDCKSRLVATMRIRKGGRDIQERARGLHEVNVDAFGTVSGDFRVPTASCAYVFTDLIVAE